MSLFLETWIILAVCALGIYSLFLVVSWDWRSKKPSKKVTVRPVQTTPFRVSQTNPMLKQSLATALKQNPQTLALNALRSKFAGVQDTKVIAIIDKCQQVAELSIGFKDPTETDIAKKSLDVVKAIVLVLGEVNADDEPALSLFRLPLHRLANATVDALVVYGRYRKSNSSQHRVERREASVQTLTTLLDDVSIRVESFKRERQDADQQALDVELATLRNTTRL